MGRILSSNTKPEIIRKDLPKGDPERSGGTYEKISDILKIDINSFYNLQSGLESTFEYFNNLNSKVNK